MSTIKVNKIENTATADGGIAIDSSGHVQVDGQQLPTAGALSNRNIFVNGGARVAQRGTSATGVTGSAYQTVDQFKTSIASLGTWTVTQETDAPAGFANSFKMDCTTADASPASGDVCAIDTYVEAQDLQVLEYGSSTAVAATLSFYVKSNKTGSGTVSILQPDNSERCINVSYTISSANTWERKTISLPADASGVINNDNGRGLGIEFWLNSGSTYSGGSAQATWGSLNNSNRNFANLGVGGSTDDYWMITGVQLELGEEATPFEHRSFGDELSKCQRYYQVIAQSSMMAATTNGSTQIANIGVPLASSMRAAPTTNSLQFTAWHSSSSSANSTTTMTVTATDPSYGMYSGAVSGFSGLTDNRVAAISPNNATLQLSAEL